MRDGLPVIALLVSAVALVVALAGVVTSGPSETPQPPEQMLRDAMAQLSDVAEERKRARREFDRLSKDVVRAIEAGPAGQGGGLDLAEVREVVKREVDASLRKRLNEEIARAKTAAGGKQAPKPAGKVKEFDDMISEMEKALSLDGNRSGRVRTALTGLRNELNTIFREERAGKIKAGERDARAGAARKRTDVKLTGILGRETFERFKKWRAASKNAYARRFFGL
jgi:hypothetical protein